MLPKFNIQGGYKVLKEKEYSLKELQKQLGFSTYSWKNRKEDLLAWLQLFYDYDLLISKDHNYTFIIYEQFAEYEPLPRSNKVSTEKRAYYAIKTKEELKRQPYNTGTNIARNTKDKKEEMNTDSIDTITRYCCNILKEDYIKDDAKWHYLDDNKLNYIPLNEEELGYLKSLFKQDSDRKLEYEAEIYSQQQQKIITQRQAKDKLNNFNKNYYMNIFSTFRDKYHHWPLSVPSWIESAF